MQMKFKMTAATLALLMGASGAQAQDIRTKGEPNEYPPASYTGSQYVDTKGCVYVRAGFDGAVTWVPRVNRKRSVMCGMAPTFAGRPAADTAPRIAAAPVIVPRQAPPTRTVAAAPPPVRIINAPTAPVAYIAPRVVTAPTYSAPRVVTAPTYSAPRVVTAPMATPSGATACPGMSPLSQQYMLGSARNPVRCGPQGGSLSGVRYGSEPGTVITVGPAPEITPPPGYKAVWEDDRLNPNRGVQTVEGYYQSSLVWTNTTPRRLIDQRSGKDVTNLFPFLKRVFPVNRTVDEQVAYRQNLGDKPRPVIVTGTKTRYSTKAVAPVRAVAAPRPSAVPSGHRFVQVGMFGVPSNAQNTAAKLQRLGLPVRVGAYQKAGKTYSIVLAGPFGSAADLRAGLNAARRAGFSDAYTRK